MLYTVLDDKGTFKVKNPHLLNTYFPLTDKEGKLLSSITPQLSGDIKKDNNHFLTPPVSLEDLKNNFLCRRDFFIKTDKDIVRVSENCGTNELEAGLLYHKLTKKIGTLSIDTLTFIPSDIPVEVTMVTVVNNGKRDLAITPTSFFPLYGRAEKNLRDHRHVSSLLNRVQISSCGIVLKPTMIFDEHGHKENKDLYFVCACEDKGIAPIGQYPTLESFYGTGSLITPDAIHKSLKPETKNKPEFSGKENCGAFRFKTKTLKARSSATYIVIAGIASTQEEIDDYFGRLNSAQKVEAALDTTKAYWQNYTKTVDFDFNDKDYNNWLIWVRLQPVMRKLFGCSFLPHFDYGKGGRGWRDLWQDALSLLLTESDKAKDIIVNSFKGVRLDGSNATIITNDGGFLSDRNHISRVWMDHGVWPYLTLRLYINRTGDLNILTKELPYYCDHQLKRAKEINKNWDGRTTLHTKDNQVYLGSILEHILIQNLSAYFNVGAHNTIKLENADWNDGLDMAADKGESVAFTFMYAHNLRDMANFIEKLHAKSVPLMEELIILLRCSIDHNDYKQKLQTLDNYLERVKNITGRKVEVDIHELAKTLRQKADHLFNWLNTHEFLAEGFVNGYYDNQGKRVEGKTADKVDMTLTGQVFSVMSLGLDKTRVISVWNSVEKYLYDKKLGGYRLNTDFQKVYMDMGRAFGFAYGDKENGAVFSHMAVMFAHALYKNNFDREGNKVLTSLYKMAKDEKAGIYPVLPEYFNGQGKGLYLYLTGSASWFIYTLLEEVLGVKFVLGNLVIEPKLVPENFLKKTISVAFAFNHKNIKVTFYKGQSKNNYEIYEGFVNGQEILFDNNRISISHEQLAHMKEAVVEVYLK